MTTAVWIEMIVIFGALAVTSYGKRRYNVTRLFIPFVILAYFAFKYVRSVPTNGNNLYILVGSIVLGLLLGLIWLKLTVITRDENATYLQFGVGSLILLAVTFLLRIVPVEWMTHHQLQTMRFALQHHIKMPSIVAPAFIFLTAVMVLVRTVVIILRVRSLSRDNDNVYKVHEG